VSSLLDSNKELLTFAHTASHDLKAPLRSLGLYHNLMRKHLGSDADAELLEYLGDAERITHRMRSLVNGLLDYATLTEATNFTETIDSYRLIEAIAADFKADIEGSGAVIVIDPTPSIVGNRVLIRQLFHNLIGNALKYCQQGSQSPSIRIAAEDLDHHWYFSVRDNGIGIDLRDQQRIFQAFQRLQYRADCDGHGLGLDICRKVVNLHRGELWVDSELGQGSDFQFTISK